MHLIDGPHRSRGFSLVELMVTVGLLALLTVLAVPSLSAWLRDDQVRAVAGSLENGLRAARAEAMRRSRVVMFVLTSDTPDLQARAAVDGTNWVVHAVPLPAGGGPELIQASSLADVARAVRVRGSVSAVCFGSLGQPVAMADGARGIACQAGGPFTFDVRADAGARPLRVVVNPSGQARWCDPARTAAAGASDGC